MNRILIPFLLVFVVGCSSFAPNYSSLPVNATPQQKKEAVIADIRLKLEDKDFQDGVYNALVLAGNLALSRAVDADEREEIKLQMYSWGKMFDDLSTGKAVSSQDVENSVEAFNLKFDADKNNDFIIAANGLFNMVFPMLKSVKDIKLSITYAQIAARACKEIGGS